MIVVLGRPALTATSHPISAAGEGAEAPDESQAETEARAADHYLAAPIAAAAAAAGARVELVGSIGDDVAGDAVVVELGQGGIGHAALLRDPAGRTPVVGADGRDGGSPPRLDAEDVRLGLGYLIDYRVLVLAEPLPPETEAVAVEAAQYHGAEVIAVVPPGSGVTQLLADAATVLEAPAEPGSRFADVVGRFAAAVDAGADPRTAFADAVRATGWERTSR